MFDKAIELLRNSNLVARGKALFMSQHIALRVVEVIIVVGLIASYVDPFSA